MKWFYLGQLLHWHSEGHSATKSKAQITVFLLLPNYLTTIQIACNQPHVKERKNAALCDVIIDTSQNIAILLMIMKFMAVNMTQKFIIALLIRVVHSMAVGPFSISQGHNRFLSTLSILHRRPRSLSLRQLYKYRLLLLPG